MTKLRFTAFLTSYCIYVPKIDEFMFSTHRTHFFRHIIHNHSVLFAKVHKKQYLCKVFRDKNLSGKRECLISCKIAKSLQRIYKARSSSYTWAAYPCCIFRCLATPTREHGGQPTFFNNKHCKISKLAVCGELL